MWDFCAELMLLGFISLLLTVFQGLIQRICIPEGWTNHMLPCKKEDQKSEEVAAGIGTEHYVVGILGGVRRLLSEEGEGSTHCSRKVFPFYPSMRISLTNYI